MDQIPQLAVKSEVLMLVEVAVVRMMLGNLVVVWAVVRMMLGNLVVVWAVVRMLLVSLVGLSVVEDMVMKLVAMQSVVIMAAWVAFHNLSPSMASSRLVKLWYRPRSSWIEW